MSPKSQRIYARQAELSNANKSAKFYAAMLAAALALIVVGVVFVGALVAL